MWVKKTYISQSEFVARDFKQDQKFVEDFLSHLDEIKEREALIEESRKKIKQGNVLRNLIKEIVREELAKQPKKGAPSFTIGKKSNEDERKTA